MAVECPVCERPFQSRLQLGRHMSTAHKEQWKPSRAKPKSGKRKRGKAQPVIEMLRQVTAGVYSPDTALQEVIKLVEYVKRLEAENRELQRQVKTLATRLTRIQGFIKSLDKEKIHE